LIQMVHPYKNFVFEPPCSTRVAYACFDGWGAFKTLNLDQSTRHCFIRSADDFRVESSRPRGYAGWSNRNTVRRKSFMQQRALLRSLALLGMAGALFGLPLCAQDSQADSVAEAARRARAQKKSAAKPATVITDDTLKPAPASGSSAPAPNDNTSAPTVATDAQAPPVADAPSAEEQEKKKAEIEALKQQVAAKQSELDLAQRELTLDNDAYYSKPNYQDDKTGAAKVAAEQADVSQKKDELEALKAKLAATGYVAPATPPPAPVGPTTLGPPRP
jgi:cytoskeletal protein RodZ